MAKTSLGFVGNIQHFGYTSVRSLGSQPEVELKGATSNVGIDKCLLLMFLLFFSIKILIS